MALAIASRPCRRPDNARPSTFSASTFGAWSSATASTPRTSAWKSSLRATKSVSELTSTTTPTVGLNGDADEALGGDAAALLGGLGEALLAQPVDRRLDVALGLVQRVLAVHHARAGLFAQILDQCGGDVAIEVPLSTAKTRPQAGARPRALKPDARPSAAISALPIAPLVARDAAVEPQIGVELLGVLRRHRGELPVMEDAVVVELLDDLRADAVSLARSSGAPRGAASSSNRSVEVSGSAPRPRARRFPAAPRRPAPRLRRGRRPARPGCARCRRSRRGR